MPTLERLCNNVNTFHRFNYAGLKGQERSTERSGFIHAMLHRPEDFISIKNDRHYQKMAWCITRNCIEKPETPTNTKSIFRTNRSTGTNKSFVSLVRCSNLCQGTLFFKGQCFANVNWSILCPAKSLDVWLAWIVQLTFILLHAIFCQKIRGDILYSVSVSYIKILWELHKQFECCL